MIIKVFRASKYTAWVHQMIPSKFSALLSKIYNTRITIIIKIVIILKLTKKIIVDDDSKNNSYLSSIIQLLILHLHLVIFLGITFCINLTNLMSQIDLTLFLVKLT